MKKMILLLVATAICVIFTACPNKPEEGVVIPDGLYEETAHFVWRTTLVYGPGMIEEGLVSDTVYTTQVLIDGGEFIYQNMCADTSHIASPDGGTFVHYHSTFIYEADIYCPDIVYQNGETQVSSTITSPARMSSDGFVIITNPYFRRSLGLYEISDYIYRAPVSKDGDEFYFEQNHEIKGMMGRGYSYHITHTLRRL